MSSVSPAYNLGQNTHSSNQLQLDPAQDLTLAVESAIRSQSSSFDESSTGDNSSYQYPPAKITGCSQPRTRLGDITPSTSFSNHSSQEHPSEDLLDFSPKIQVSNDGKSPNLRPQPISLEKKDSSLANASSVALEFITNAPNKRMADGNVKYVGHSLPSSPVEIDSHKDLVVTSVTFKNSPIGELSDQLRTRLSYAMVKVQNGWQSRSLEELESLSQHGSPISAFAETEHIDESRPKATKLRLRRTESTTSYQHGAVVSESIPNKSDTYSRAQDLVKSPSEEISIITSTQPHQTGRTYESFWREHSANSVSKYVQTQDQSLRRPSLAPPADILSRSRRRPSSFKTPPTLGISSNAKFSDEHIADPAISNLIVSPAPPENPSSIRTASQNAAMEKDAVETLLFMSSPGNSGHYSSARRVDSPLRSSFAIPEKRVGFAATTSRDDSSHQEVLRSQAIHNSTGFFSIKGVVSEADVDRILDDMPDGESSSEDEDNTMI